VGPGRSCEGCGRGWPASARWCGACGHPLSAPVTAPPSGRRRVHVLVVALATVAVVTLGLSASLAGGRADRVQLRPPERPTTQGPATSSLETIADGPVCRTERGTVECVVWDVPFPARARVLTTALGDDVVTVATDGRVTARSLDTGAPRWTHRLDVRPATPASTPSLRDPRRLEEPVAVLAEVQGMVVVRVGDQLVFLEAVKGGVASRMPLPVEPVDVAVAGDWLLLTDGARVTNLLANGISTWTIDVPAGATAAVTGHGPYLVEDATVTQISKVAGLPRWQTTLDGPVRPLDVAVDDGRAGLFAVEGDRPAVVALAEPDGATRWRLPLAGPMLELSVDDHRLVAIAEGPDGPVVSVATVREGHAEQRWSGHVRLGARVSGVQPPTTAGRTVAVVAANPTPTLWLATLDGRLLVREALPTVPYGAAMTDPGTVVVADVTGVRARAVTTGEERWRVGLRDARLLSGSPTVVSGDRGLLRLRPDTSRSASPPVRSGG
jgi:hypothetical protein